MIYFKATLYIVSKVKPTKSQQNKGRVQALWCDKMHSIFKDPKWTGLRIQNYIKYSKTKAIRLSEYILEVRRLIELCGLECEADQAYQEHYNSGHQQHFKRLKSQSIRVHQICQIEDAMRRQVQVGLL